MCQSSGISAVWIMSRQLKLYRGQPAQNLNVEHWILQDLVRILQDLVRILQDLVRILQDLVRIVYTFSKGHWCHHDNKTYL